MEDILSAEEFEERYTRHSYDKYEFAEMYARYYFVAKLKNIEL